MIQQIEDSIRWDCTVSFTYPILETKEDYINRQYEYFFNDIEYHTTEYGKEVERVLNMNKWIKQLRESLKDFE